MFQWEFIPLSWTESFPNFFLKSLTNQSEEIVANVRALTPERGMVDSTPSFARKYRVLDAVQSFGSTKLQKRHGYEMDVSVWNSLFPNNTMQGYMAQIQT
jgi:hypothetical protein